MIERARVADRSGVSTPPLRAFFRGERFTITFVGREATDHLQAGRLDSLARAAGAGGIVKPIEVVPTAEGGFIRFEVVQNPIFIPIIIAALVGGAGALFVSEVAEDAVQATTAADFGPPVPGTPGFGTIALVGIGAVAAFFFLRRRGR